MQSSLGIHTFIPWLWIPPAILAAMLVIGFWWFQLFDKTCSGLSGKVEAAAKDAMSEAKAREERKAKKDEGFSEIALQPADQLYHDMVGYHPLPLLPRPLSSRLRSPSLAPVLAHLLPHPLISSYPPPSLTFSTLPALFFLSRPSSCTT